MNKQAMGGIYTLGVSDFKSIEILSLSISSLVLQGKRSFLKCLSYKCIYIKRYFSEELATLTHIPKSTIYQLKMGVFHKEKLGMQDAHIRLFLPHYILGCSRHREIYK